MKVYSGNMIIPDVQRVIPPINAGGSSSAVTPSAENKSFQDVFNQTLDASKTLQFSKHANMRLSSRDIKLSNEQLQRIESGVDSAKAKGIKDSLVLVDDVALVVNIRSKTVITAMCSGNERSSENVFTNIDGAVIV